MTQPSIFNRINSKRQLSLVTSTFSSKSNARNWYLRVKGLSNKSTFNDEHILPSQELLKWDSHRVTLLPGSSDIQNCHRSHLLPDNFFIESHFTIIQVRSNATNEVNAAMRADRKTLQDLQWSSTKDWTKCSHFVDLGILTTWQGVDFLKVNRHEIIWTLRDIIQQTRAFGFSESNAAPHFDLLLPFAELGSSGSVWAAMVKFPLLDNGFVKQVFTTNSADALKVSIISGGKKSRFFSIKSRAS